LGQTGIKELKKNKVSVSFLDLPVVAIFPHCIMPEFLGLL
jgi:hypothetical protein